MYKKDRIFDIKKINLLATLFVFSKHGKNGKAVYPPPGDETLPLFYYCGYYWESKIIRTFERPRRHDHSYITNVKIARRERIYTYFSFFFSWPRTKSRFVTLSREQTAQLFVLSGKESHLATSELFNTIKFLRKRKTWTTLSK